jgi:hypothetical protein
VPQSSSREGMDRTGKLTQRVPQIARNEHNPNKNAYRATQNQVPSTKPSCRYQGNLHASSVGLTGLNCSHRRDQHASPHYVPHPMMRDSILVAAFQPENCQRTYRIAVSGNPTPL